MKPLAIDLCCGLGGWTDGLLSEGYDVVGFDIENHCYGELRYPAQLVLQNILTIHGSQFANASLIVASPPCQKFSYMLMPWKRAKLLAEWYSDPEHPERVAELTALFDATFRIQREACEAAGKHIPLVVENVRGAQRWVGRSRWNYGSYYLWGDVPALMPIAVRASKAPGFRFGGSDESPSASFQTACVKQSDGVKGSGQDWSRFAKTGEVSPHWNVTGMKNAGGSWFAQTHGKPNALVHNPDGRPADGVKHQASGAAWFDSGPASFGSKTSKRKIAAALIAKIPLPLAQYIARVYYPKKCEVA
jgi:hypothetical protein